MDPFLGLGLALGVAIPAPLLQDDAAEPQPTRARSEITTTEVGSLAGYFGDPDLYLEFDFETWAQDCSSSGLGRLFEFIEPLAQHHGAPAGGLTLPIDGSRIVIPTVGIFEPGENWEQSAAVLADFVSGLIGIDPVVLGHLAHSLSPRVSYAGASSEPWDEEADGDEWALGWRLQTGGADVLYSSFFPALAEILSDGAVKMEALPETDGARPAWLLVGPKIGRTFLCLREDLVAWTGSVRMAERLRHADTPRGLETAELTNLQLERREALEGEAGIFAFMGAETIMRRQAFEDAEARSYLAGLGLNQLGDVSVRVGEDHGQLTSRVRVECKGRAGVLSLVEGRETDWACLDSITSDALAVAGFPRSARDFADDLIESVLWWDPTAYKWMRQHWKHLRALPVIGSALEPGSFEGETVVFARPSGGIWPDIYVCSPMSPKLREHFEEYETGAAQRLGWIEPRAGAEIHQEVRIEVRTFASQGEETPFWVTGNPVLGQVSWTRQGDFLVLAEEPAAIQRYLEQRTRERIAYRQQVAGEIRERVRWMSSQSELGGLPAGFFHVRVQAVVQRLWPLAAAALSLAGVDLSALPGDPIQLASELGDTTLVLFEGDGFLELHGRGMLGGLLGGL